MPLLSRMCNYALADANVAEGILGVYMSAWDAHGANAHYLEVARPLESILDLKIVVFKHSIFNPLEGSGTSSGEQMQLLPSFSTYKPAAEADKYECKEQHGLQHHPARRR
jgi:hypothetical protein